MEPESFFFQFRKVRFPISIAGGQENSSCGLILPVCSAAMPTKTLNVEPGGYAERNARGSSGISGSDWSRLNSSVEIAGTNEFGLNTGHEAIARTSPVFGSIIT